MAPEALTKVSSSAPSAPTSTGGSSNDAAGLPLMLHTVPVACHLGFDTRLDPDRISTQAVRPLPGLSTAARTAIAPTNEDEYEPKVTQPGG